MRRFLAAAIGLCATLPIAAAMAAPMRVASLNVCADQLLLALAPERIVSLSPLARDPGISYFARKAAHFSGNTGRAETMVVDRPDLVLAGRFDGKARVEFLRGQGIEVMIVDPWSSMADGAAQIRTVAARLGETARGEKMIARIDAALARSRNASPRPASVIALGNGLFAAGERSLTGEILRHLGLRTHPHHPGGFARLERIVADPPDFVLGGLGEAGGQGAALFQHPAFDKAVPRERRLSAPAGLLTCGGPSMPAALDALAEEVRAKVR